MALHRRQTILPPAHHLHQGEQGLCLFGGGHSLVLEACIELENQQHLEALFCVDCLEDALRLHGRPEVFNSEQGERGSNSRVNRLLESFMAKESPSACTAAAGPTTISLWNGFGDR